MNYPNWNVFKMFTCVLYSSRWESLKSWNTWICVFLTKKYPCCSVLPSSRGQYWPHLTRPRSITLRTLLNQFYYSAHHTWGKCMPWKSAHKIGCRYLNVSPGGHDNNKYHLFPNHSPEVNKCFWQRTWKMRGDGRRMAWSGKYRP